ncbi:MAG: transporter related protein, partial [Humibacillus sp.]|nr:transporter related protein [Humibacillus sp.]
MPLPPTPDDPGPVTTGPTLTARGLTLAYDGRVVVDGLDLAVPAGRTTVIVGANGCGKSTVLRGLARLLRPRAGSVHLTHGHPDRGGEDREIWAVRPKDFARSVALLPQAPPLP